MGSSLAGMIHTIAFNVLACLAHASHARAMLTDPGAVSRYAEVGYAELLGGEGREGGARWTDRKGGGAGIKNQTFISLRF